MESALFLVLLFPLLPLLLASTQTTYYVRPTSESPCHHEDCLTLTEYASEASSYFNSDNLTLVFLPGEYALNTSIDFQMFQSLTLLGDLSSLPNTTSNIVCNETSAFTLMNISEVEIKALAFDSCGIQGNFTNFYIIRDSNGYGEVVEIRNVVPAISVLLIPKFYLVSCHLEHNHLPLLLNNSRAYLRDNTFEDNNGGLGGALASYNSTVVFLGQNLFLGNEAVVGGGVFANRSELVFRGSTAFINNTAKYGGGVGAMGSIITYGNTTNTSMTTDSFNNSCSKIRECTIFVHNLARYGGGGIWLVNSTMRQNGGTLNFTGNCGHTGGGMIGINCIITLNGFAIFKRNSATCRVDRGLGLARGGAVAVQSSTWNSIATTFVDNSAEEGGAVYSGDSQLKFGALVHAGATVAASQKKSTPNPPYTHMHHYYQSSFSKNSASKRGGAITADRSIVEFSGNSNFEHNSATFDGGGIYTQKSKLFFGELTAINNSESFEGDGDWTKTSKLQFEEHSTFTGNNAGSDGGGIAAYCCTLVFSGMIELFSNEAKFDGGAIDLLASTLNISGKGTYINNTAGYSGGVLRAMYYSTLNSNGNATYINNTAGESGGVVSAYHSALNISGNGTYINNTAGDSGGVVIATQSTDIVLDGWNTLASNSAGSTGGAVSVEDSTLRITGKCDFVENWAHNSGSALYAEESDLKLSGENSFIGNVAKTDGYGGGIHAVMTVLTLNGLHTFTNNSARYGGGLAVREQSTLIATTNTNFKENSASNGGAVFAEEASDLEFSGMNIFANNVAKSVQFPYEGYGGGIHAVESRITFSGSSNFTNNSARYGGGLAVRVQSTLNATTNINFRENTASYGGAVFAEGASYLVFSGMNIFANNVARSVQFPSEGYGGGIHAEESRITFSGLANFTNNSATYGGALAITSYDMDQFLYLTPSASVAFIDNYAHEYGGAIFVKDAQDPFVYCRRDLDILARTCFIKLYLNHGSLPLVRLPNLFYETYKYVHECISHIVTEGNFAEEGGSTIYGGALHGCRVEFSPEHLCKYDGCSNGTCYMSGIEAVATLTRTSKEQVTRNPLNVASDTYKICICDVDSRTPNCKRRPVSSTAYPGETVFLLLVAVGEKGEVLSGAAVIYANISESEEAWLGIRQNTQSVHLCTYLGYTLFSSSTRSAKLTLSTEGPCGEPGIPLYVNVNFLSCPAGFMLSQFGSCGCERRLHKYTNSCDINNRAFTRNGQFWMGFDHSHGLILHPHCPFDYCKLEVVSFTLNSTDLQCAHRKSGTLCGACKSGLSLNLGSSQCSACSNVFLLLFLPLAIAGFLLVIFLFIFKVTVAAGTTSGLIFYANVVAVNRNVLFTSGETNILTVFIAWLNLDLGIETCFFDGMDVYTRTWLQFVFPLYIWLLVGIITLASYYSMAVARIIGPTNPVSVLATLFLLSYAKLLRAIIATFSFTSLDYLNDRSVTVWVYDGNIGYIEGKHIPLFLAGLLAFLLLFLPYTLLLLFGQCIEAGSNHKLLSWANNLKAKSFLDAYHAPYKNKHRYWTGLLLVLRFVLFIVSAVIDINSPRDPSVNFLLLGITCAGLMVLAWNIGSMYNRWYNNVLESSFILNLTILVLASYQVKVEGGNQAAVAYTSVSIAFVTFLGIISYHVAERVKNSRTWRNSFGPKLLRLKKSLTNRQQHQDPIEMAVPPTAPPPPVTTTFVDLREPLLESQH